MIVNNIKYSIFGKFDFLTATSENMTKLYNILGKEKFLPNTIQMIQIEQPSNNVTKVMRPQFIKEKHCNISFLPERIDIESENESFSAVMRYMSDIIENFNLKINRLALAAHSEIDISNEQAEILRKNMFNEKNCVYKDKVLEWNYRIVDRKQCDDIDEMVNVGQSIQSIDLYANDGDSHKRLLIDTDINTIAENSSDRFSKSKSKKFFTQVKKWNNEIIDYMGEYINEQLS